MARARARARGRDCVVNYKKSTIAWQFFCALPLSTQLSTPPSLPTAARTVLLCTILIKYKMFTLIIST